MSTKYTDHVTGVGEIAFMAAARPFTDKESGKSTYSIKLILDENDSAISHLRSISPKKVNTETNMKLKGSGTMALSFSSQKDIKVFDADNNLLTGDEIPFFDSRVDTGTAAVAYTVATYENGKTGVYLNSIKLKDLNLAPKENTADVVSKIKDMLNNV